MQIFFIISCWVIFAIAHGKTGFGPGDQEWGYITVRPGAQMFYWIYKTTAKVSTITEKPLIVWLQGGPGCSSTGFGNFMEIGPIDLEEKKRNISWVSQYNVLFIDNPVGTGYSLVQHISNIPKTNKAVTKDLVTFLNLFYKEYPIFQTCALYLVGESYGGKFAIELALALSAKRSNIMVKKNLKGVLLIDGWISPIDTILNYHLFLYYTGILDKESSKLVEKATGTIQTTMVLRQFKLATKKWQSTLELIANVTNNVDFYNILKQAHKDIDKKKLENFMNGRVKTQLALNGSWILDSQDVFTALEGDFMRSVSHIVEMVLEQTSIKVFVVTGELDLIVNTPGTVQWVSKLSWLKRMKWRTIPRTILTGYGSDQGFKKTVGTFSFFWVRGAGHMVPMDNPEAMMVILKDMINP